MLFAKVHRSSRGFGFIDAIVATSLLVIAFLGIFGLIRLSVQLIGVSKAKVGATALANEQMEFIRSLPYSEVAVEGGIPAGEIPQEEEVSLNNITYTRRTSIQYVDDPADGTAASGTDPIFTDYKVTRVEVSWQFRGAEKEVVLISNIVPKGLETTEGGGVLWITVLDALGIPMQGAEVHVTNDTTDPVVDVSTFTNLAGQAVFPGAATGTNYAITVMRDGYSSAQTYEATAENPNPNPGHLTVVLDTITYATFQIDEVAQKTVATFEPVRTATWTDPFDDSSLIESLTNTEVVSGEVRLLNTGTYPPEGEVVSVGIAPTYLAGWQEALWEDGTSASTTATYHVEYLDETSGFIPVPDSALPGNSTGFDTPPIDLSGLSSETYDTLRLIGELGTVDPNQTPSITEWQIVYDEGPIPLPDIPFTMRGEKTIGTDGGGLPIYKYSESLQTDDSGVLVLPDLEWDIYTIDVTTGGLTVAEICPPQPLALNPGVVATTSIILSPATAHSLTVVVQDAITEVELEGTSVQLERSGYNVTQLTSACGQTFFPGLVQANDYTLTVTHPGYVQSTSTVEVSGATQDTVFLDSL